MEKNDLTVRTTIARPLAPEDLRVDQYVCVLQVLHEFVPLWCIFEQGWTTPEPVRLSMLPPDGGTPLRIVEVCVPFVLVEQIDGTHQTLDLRRHRLAALSERFGRRAFKRLRKRPGSDANRCA